MRKHHNKLYYGKFAYKTVFKMPGSLMFYPTTDKHLAWLKKEYADAPDMNRLADFIIDNRKKIKFRLQDKHAIFYTNKSLAQELIDGFWQFWYDSTEVDINARLLKKNQVICKRIPHGQYPYQIHLKKDTHQHLDDKDRDALWNILSNNKNNCLVSHRYVYDFLSGKAKFCYEGYFYVRDEKMLTMINLLAGKGIKKIVNFIEDKNGSHKKIKR